MCVYTLFYVYVFSLLVYIIAYHCIEIRYVCCQTGEIYLNSNKFLFALQKDEEKYNIRFLNNKESLKILSITKIVTAWNNLLIANT